MSDFEELYQEIIMDHSRRPRGAADLSSLPESLVHENPTCGDSIKVALELSGEGRIEGLRFDVKGCAISTASASLMSGYLRGKGALEARASAAAFIGALRGDLGLEELDAMGDLAALRGVSIYPMRVKCATLAWHAFLAALDRAALDRSPESVEPSSP
jgi:nitrogen fixation protein NifU and related proteins